MNNKELEATLEQMAEEEALLDEQSKVLQTKRELPMLYTSRGKLIKHPSKPRISGKNAAELLNNINAVQNAGDNLVLVMPNYVVTFSPVLSFAIRANGLVAEIMLAGYTLR